MNEDTVMQFASLVREFGRAVQQTRDDATAAVHDLAQTHQGAPTEKMISGRAELSQRHDRDRDDCGILAETLEAYPGYIEVQRVKCVAITE